MAVEYIAGSYQGIRLFFSVDISRSTALKSEIESGRDGSKDEDWKLLFISFFQSISQDFKVAAADDLEQNCEHKSEASGRIFIWRILGDEVLFYSSIITREEQVTILVSTFYKVIRKYSENSVYLKLAVKGAVWAAGFPNRNTEILTDPYKDDYPKILTADARHLPELLKPSISDTNPELNEDDNYFQIRPELNSFYRDFLGTEIDAGFRLKSFSSPHCVVISTDVARLAVIGTKGTQKFTLRYFHVGYRILEGCYANASMPIIYVDNLPSGSAGIDDGKLKVDYAENHLLFCYRPENEVSGERVKELDEVHRKEEDVPGYRIPMYIDIKDAPKSHRDRDQKWGQRRRD